MSKARKDDLIRKGKELMDHACPNVRNEVKSIIGKEGRDDALVAIILASAAELKRMPAFLVRGRGAIVENPGDNDLIIENVHSSWNIKRQQEELAKLVPELDYERDYSGRLAIRPFLRLASGAAAAWTRIVYNGPVTPTLLSHIRGESVMYQESLAHGLFFRAPIAGEPFIWIKSTAHFRGLLKVLVSSEYTNTELKCFLNRLWIILRRNMGFLHLLMSDCTKPGLGEWGPIISGSISGSISGILALGSNGSDSIP